MFHYVSASPWQLAEPLLEMMSAHRFPRGSLHLRDFRLADVGSLNKLANANSKKAAIARLLSEFPKRRFLLFGDSGEQDPELYGEFARKHPQQVLGIFIHNVSKKKPDAKRFREAFRGLKGMRWRVFSDPGDLEPMGKLQG